MRISAAATTVKVREKTGFGMKIGGVENRYQEREGSRYIPSALSLYDLDRWFVTGS